MSFDPFAKYLIGIDPGPTQSSATKMVCPHGERRYVPESFVTLENSQFYEWLRSEIGSVDILVIEKPENFGMAGGSVLDTMLAVGRCSEIALVANVPVCYVHPRQKMAAAKVATKTQVNAVLKQEYGSGKTGKGTKKNPSLLYGIVDHEWSALAVGYTWSLFEFKEYLGDLDVQTIETVVVTGNDQPRERWRKERDNRRKQSNKDAVVVPPVAPRLAEGKCANPRCEGTSAPGSCKCAASYCRACHQPPGFCDCPEGFQSAGQGTPALPV